MSVAISDAVGVMFLTLTFILLAVRSRGILLPYLPIPLLLMYVHVFGNTLQEMNKGPEWLQYHLHDVGVAMLVVGPATMVVRLLTRPQTPAEDFAKRVMTLVLLGHLLGTALCVLYKVLQVTVDRERTIAEGYSGNLDYGDLAALGIGFLIMVVNHVVAKRRILQKIETNGKSPHPSNSN